MRRRGPGIALVVLCGLLLAAQAGCQGSSQAYRFDRDSVWWEAVGETVAWRPNVIDTDKRRVTSRKTNLAGTEVEYEMKVVTDLNPFALRPSTRVYVRMEQVKPKRIRFARLERDCLARIKQKLQARRPRSGE